MRLLELDLLRGQAIIAVVTLHAITRFYVIADSSTAGGVFAILLYGVAIVGVPIFLLLSGAGLSLAYPDPLGTPVALGRFFARRARRVVIPYVTWSLVSLYVSGFSSWTLGALARILLTGGASFQYYFIPLICQFYILFPLLQPLFRRSDDPSVASLVTLGSVLATSAWWESGWPHFPDPWWLPAWFVYPALGAVLAPRLAAARARARGSRSWIVLAGMLWLFLFALWFLQAKNNHSYFSPNMYQPLMVALSIAAAVLLFCIDLWAVARRGWFQRVFREIGHHSYGIFLIHALFLGWVAPYTLAWLSGWIGTGVAVVDLVAAMALSYVSVRVLSAIPVARALLT